MRVERPVIARILVIAIIAAATIIPWVVAAIAGIVTPQTEEGLFVAAPSPIYAFYMLDDTSKSIHETSNIEAGWVCIVGWAVLGIVLLGAAFARSRRIIRTLDAAVTETDRRLAEEDALSSEVERAAAAEAPMEADAEAVG